MPEHCFICLSDTPPLKLTCEEGTCHNLKAHPACFAKITAVKCAICKQPYDRPRPSGPPVNWCGMCLILIWGFVGLLGCGAFVTMLVYIREIPPGLIGFICGGIFAVVVIAWIQIQALWAYSDASVTPDNPV